MALQDADRDLLLARRQRGLAEALQRVLQALVAAAARQACLAVRRLAEMLPAQCRHDRQIAVDRLQVPASEARIGVAPAERKEQEAAVIQFAKDRHLVAQLDILVINTVILGLVEAIGGDIAYQHRAGFAILAKARVKRIELVDAVEIHIEIDPVGCSDGVVDMERAIAFV